MTEPSKIVCPKCGKDDQIRKHGFKLTQSGKIQQYQCKTCVHVFYHAQAKPEKDAFADLTSEQLILVEKGEHVKFEVLNEEKETVKVECWLEGKSRNRKEEWVTSNVEPEALALVEKAKAGELATSTFSPQQLGAESREAKKAFGPLVGKTVDPEQKPDQPKKDEEKKSE